MDKTELFYENIQRIVNKEKGLSYSALSAFIKSPRHYYKYVTDKETTEAMEKGKRFHMAILEPDKYKEQYFVFDDTDKVKEIGGKSPRATTKYKEWKIEYLRAKGNKKEISKKEHDTYEAMQKSLQMHSVTKNFMLDKLSENEKSFTYEEDNYMITGKIDKASKGYTVDFKKVADASYNKIKWDIERNNYDIQGVNYSKGNNTSNHYIVFIDEGCNITVVLAELETLIRWEEKYNTALDNFTKCIENDSWHMSYDFYQDIIRI
jgi:hypothetical protein